MPTLSMAKKQRNQVATTNNKHKNKKSLQHDSINNSKSHTSKHINTTKNGTTSPKVPQVSTIIKDLPTSGKKWYEVLKTNKIKSMIESNTTGKKKHGNEIPSHEIETASIPQKQLAQKLLEAEIARFEQQKQLKLSSDEKYLATMMKSGTLADRVAALTLTVQSAPLHNLQKLSQLIAMAKKKARRESIMAIDSLKDLFLNNLLPDDRKLKFFHQNPFSHPDVTSDMLVVWFFEHCLKTAFAQLIGVLADGMSDAVDNHKRCCIRAATALLSGKPEQEAMILSLLVNKLGDPDRKIAGYLHKLLTELLRDHPNMKRILVNEVSGLVVRPQVAERARYNAIVFLNQLYLDKNSEDDTELAQQLIRLYFGIFSKEVQGNKSKESVKKSKGKAVDVNSSSMDKKLLSSLLVGVNRAFPYAPKSCLESLQAELNLLFKVVHTAAYSTSIQALMLLFQLTQNGSGSALPNNEEGFTDRFYSALYGKLISPQIRETTKHTLLLNLIFRAMKSDESISRTCAFMKRLLQVATSMPPAFICAVLFLLSELIKFKPDLRMLLDKSEKTKSTKSLNQTQLPIKLKELAKSNPESNVSELDEEGIDENDPVENDGLTEDERSSRALKSLFGESLDTTILPDPVADRTYDESDTESSNSEVVSQPMEDPSIMYHAITKRNPKYANAEYSCAWEMSIFVNHFHPSVQMFTRQLLLKNLATKGEISYLGDPLVDFTLHAFFEKFVNKKPRFKSTASKDESNTDTGKRWSFVPVNTASILEIKNSELDVTDEFFYKFFKERANRPAGQAAARRQKKSKLSHDDDDEGMDMDALCDGDEDGEMDAFAQELAEGLMEDGNLDDEDVDMEGWSGSDDENESGEETNMASGDNEFGDASDEDDAFSDDMDDEEVFNFDDDIPHQSSEEKQFGVDKKSPFASVDDYEKFVRVAKEREKALTNKRKLKQINTTQSKKRKS